MFLQRFVFVACWTLTSTTEAFTAVPTTTTRQSIIDTTTTALSSTTANITTTAGSDATVLPPLKNSNWFPTRIQETVPYRDVVQRLYLRHIVTETKGLADWVVQQVYADTASDNKVDVVVEDTFAALARNISACPHTRPEGGKIGWVEAHDDYQILPADVVAAVYDRQPKPGDVLVVGPSRSTQQWHCVQVMEAWMQPLADSAYEGARVGAHQGINRLVKRAKLKGAGVLPTFPSQMQAYTIQTAGCQMNVADSERLEGVLQDQLRMKPATKASEADLVLLNTCRYVHWNVERNRIEYWTKCAVLSP